MSSIKPVRRIVVDDAIPEAERLFGDLGEVILLPGRAIDTDAVREADALIVRSRTRVDATLLAGSRVEFVGSTVVGLDHVDRRWLNEAGIHFYSAQGCNAVAVAEYIIANLLRWACERKETLRGRALAVIGVGHVGEQVRRRAEALGLRLLLNDPPRAEREPAFPHTPLETCLREADFITLHTPLTDEGPHPTRHLLNRTNMGLIRPDAMLINAARGGIVDEAAWLETDTAADIIDCWENEPRINPKLFRRAWLATPHIAGHSLDAKLRGGVMASQALRRFWRAPLLNEAEIFARLPAPRPLELPESEDPICRLTDLCRQAHDFTRDQRALEPMDDTLPERFEHWRRHYPPRREWHAHALPAGLDEATRSAAVRLGFMGE
ncbi:4-phosphoerythronate dehydrogenase [Sulfurivirga sp.]|uniref:4-phosphoerythronate dehydrogenase n=1 Tax=Sulfurivirga sp. TaxID=2614236 RepID=UPI0025D2A39D|nr:4-phosphoerythronate dehydrogenase [Sulfurivirga sp.]